MPQLERLIAATRDCTPVLDPYQTAYYRAHVERHDGSFQELARCVVLSLPTGVYSSRGIEKLVRINFGHGISFISVRKDLRCKDEQVRVYREAVAKRMREIRQSLKEALENIIRNQ